MSLNFYNVKRWIKMITGKSIEHVNQGVGKIYSLSQVKGYYNDLTEKVLRDKEYDKIKLPILITNKSEKVYFSISIFQYGLGAYDLYLLTKKDVFLNIFKMCLDWAVNNQNENGSWNSFSFLQPSAPYSAMAQGEGISLLLRGFQEFNNEEYLIKSKKAANFLIVPLEKGGTTMYTNNEIFFQEYTNKPTVLNGWIFTLFGLYDYLKVVNDNKIREIYHTSIQTLLNNLEKFDNGYWSNYNIKNMITSPFYHRLHIAQLYVMYEITGELKFKKYYEKWNEYKNKRCNKRKAFIVKAFQKIFQIN